jgi:SAM-dependent methyltransferase
VYVKTENDNSHTNLETSQMNTAASASFETQFMSHSLEQQITHCDHYELAPYFKIWLTEYQPILEAGSGSGRWVAWFLKNGWSAVGLDWSEKLCDRARRSIPGSRFEVGDMRNMPFEDGEFGAIVSLGAVEHTPDGPLGSLKEYYRVLRKNGIGIITVPHLGIFRRLQRFISSMKSLISQNSFLRRLLGKQVGLRTLKEAKLETLSGFAADFFAKEQGWEFYQYNFSKSQMRTFLQEAGFEVIEEFVEFGDEGIISYFGKIAGIYDDEKGVFVFTSIGKLLRKIIPLDKAGHMLCYLVRKSELNLRGDQ